MDLFSFFPRNKFFSNKIKQWVKTYITHEPPSDNKGFIFKV
jgi:hypothetical protein